MIKTRILLAAIILDSLIGDPEPLPHPVRVMGGAIAFGERLARRFAKTPLTEFVGGSIISLTVIAGSYLVGRDAIRFAALWSKTFGAASEIWLAAGVLATRNLHSEAAAVVQALETNNLTQARRQLARIVGRDAHDLNETEIARAVIETVAESTCDGVIAPLFYLTLGGVPLALAYKAVNTLDSMIGHREKPYFYFGKFAARLDDAANFVPARITAVLIIGGARVVGGNLQTAWNVWWRDGSRHSSPNAGQSEAALSGALETKLGGTNFYDGAAHCAPILGAEFAPPTAAQARKAVKLAVGAAILGYAAAVLATAVFSARKN